MTVDEQISELKAQGRKWTVRPRKKSGGRTYYVVMIGGRQNLVRVCGDDGSAFKYRYKFEAQEEADLLNGITKKRAPAEATS